jgi:hypothetical protein
VMAYAAQSEDNAVLMRDLVDAWREEVALI